MVFSLYEQNRNIHKMTVKCTFSRLVFIKFAHFLLLNLWLSLKYITYHAHKGQMARKVTKFIDIITTPISNYLKILAYLQTISIWIYRFFFILTFTNHNHLNLKENPSYFHQETCNRITNVTKRKCIIYLKCTQCDFNLCLEF